MMRSNLILFGVLLFIAGCSARAESSGNIAGAWELVRVENPDGTTWTSPHPHTLINSATRYAWGTLDESGSTVHVGGGRYTIEGDVLTTTLDYHGQPSAMEAPTSKATIRIEKDTLYKTNLDGPHNDEVEVWRRVD